jgi:hypothetical protein
LVFSPGTDGEIVEAVRVEGAVKGSRYAEAQMALDSER